VKDTVVSETKRIRSFMVNAWMKIERGCNIESSARHSTNRGGEKTTTVAARSEA